MSGKPRLLASKKPAAKTGGLGVKKATNKVDDSIFDQKPAEAPVVAIGQVGQARLAITKHCLLLEAGCI